MWKETPMHGAGSLRRHAATPIVVAIAAALAIITAPGMRSGPRAFAPSSAGGAAQALRFALDHQGPRPGRRVPGAPEREIDGLTQIEYYNWSGYADDDTQGNTYTMVSGKWVQPAVTCPTDEDRLTVFWVGLDGFDNGTVEQDGTLAWCFDGSPSYYSWWEMYPTNDIQTVGSSVVPGDKISASVTFASGKYSMKLADATNPANSFTQKAVCGKGLSCENASAEWIAETPSTARGYWPWPDFKTWSLTSAKVKSGSTTGTISSFPDDEITIVGIDGQNLANTGALNGPGNAFSDTWSYAY
jgi:hypothetical protein